MSAPRPSSPLPMAPRLRPSQEAPHIAQIYDTRDYQRARRQPSPSRPARKGTAILLAQMFGLGALFMISFGYFSNSEFRQTVNGAVSSVLPANPATSGTADVQRTTAEIDPFAPADTVVLQQRESLPIIKLDDTPPPAASPPPVAEALEPPPVPLVLKAPEPVPAPEIVKTPELLVAEAPEPVPAPEIVKAPEPVPEPLVAEAPEPSPEPVMTKAPEPVPEPVVEITAEPLPTPVVVKKTAEPVPEPVVQTEIAPPATLPPPVQPEPVVEQEIPAPAAEENVVAAAAGSSTSAADTVAVVEAPKTPSKLLMHETNAVTSAPQRTQGEAFSDCPNCPELVAVVPKEGANKPVNANFSGISPIQPYAIGGHEITFDDWDRCVAEGGCPKQPADEGWGRGQRPVIGVSFDDINEQYLPWLSRVAKHAYRLPTEAEWEMAARGGSLSGQDTVYSFGNDEALLCEYGNSSDLSAKTVDKNWTGTPCNDGFATTAPVGSLKPNALGLFDMHGNVWEWVSDCLRTGYSKDPTKNAEDCNFRVLRGGSWASQAQALRTSERGWEKPDKQKNSIGFRVARSLR